MWNIWDFSRPSRLLALIARYCAVSGTKYISEPGKGLMPAFMQAWYSSTLAAMFPWSCIPTAGCPIAATWLTIDCTEAMASFTLYLEWVCRDHHPGASGVGTTRHLGVGMIFISWRSPSASRRSHPWW